MILMATNRMAKLMQAKEPTAAPAAPTRLLDLDLRTIVINLEGTTPFICHNWDKKNIEKMANKQAGTASKGRVRGG